jgi:hypothetical protein
VITASSRIKKIISSTQVSGLSSRTELKAWVHAPCILGLWSFRHDTCPRNYWIRWSNSTKTPKLVRYWMKCSNKRVVGYFWVRKSLFVDINVYHLHMYMVRGGFLLLFFRIIKKNYKKQMMRKWILERNWCEKKRFTSTWIKNKKKRTCNWYLEN